MQRQLLALCPAARRVAGRTAGTSAVYLLRVSSRPFGVSHSVFKVSKHVFTAHGALTARRSTLPNSGELRCARRPSAGCKLQHSCMQNYQHACKANRLMPWALSSATTGAQPRPRCTIRVPERHYAAISMPPPLPGRARQHHRPSPCARRSLPPQTSTVATTPTDTMDIRRPGTARLLALLLCIAFTGVQSARLGGSGRERACGSAFAVLRRCGAASGRQDDLLPRCCGLLARFKINGCLW